MSDRCAPGPHHRPGRCASLIPVCFATGAQSYDAHYLAGPAGQASRARIAAARADAKAVRQREKSGRGDVSSEDNEVEHVNVSG